MLALSMGSDRDPYSFIYVDEDEWRIVEKQEGPYVIGAAQIGGDLYSFVEGKDLWCSSIGDNGIARQGRAVAVGVEAPGAHSMIPVDNESGIAFTVSDFNQLWLYDRQTETIRAAAVTQNHGLDYSHLNGLCRDQEGWWYVSMLCWHREDKVRWRDRERLGIIARFKNPFDDNAQADILYSRLRAPHSLVWDQDSGLWFCNSLASELRCNDEVVVRLDTPYFVRGLVVEPPRVWFGASPRGASEGTPEFGRLYEYNTDSGRLRHLDIGSEREGIRDIYDIVRTAPGQTTGDGKPVRRASQDRRAIIALDERISAAERKMMEREQAIAQLCGQQDKIATSLSEIRDAIPGPREPPLKEAKPAGKA